MSSVGETLRRERLNQHLEIDGVSRELKISSRMLEFIEADQWEKLPGGVFAKAFVRQYAGLLGLDGEALAGQVQRSIEPPSLSTEKERPAVHPIDVPRVDEWNSVGDRGARSGWLPAAALVIVVMLVCSAVYAWMQRPHAAPAPAPAPVQTPVAQVPVTPAPVQSTPPPSGTPETGAAAPSATPAATESPATAQPQPAIPAQQPVSAASQPPKEAPKDAPKAEQPPPGPPGPVHLEIVAEEPVWVLARVDGKFAFSGTMEANARRTVDGTQNVLIRLGNAGGVTILQNGKSIGPPGPKGQVRTLQFSTTGFQVITAKPPDAPQNPDR